MNESQTLMKLKKKNSKSLITTKRFRLRISKSGHYKHLAEAPFSGQNNHPNITFKVTTTKRWTKDWEISCKNSKSKRYVHCRLNGQMFSYGLETATKFR